MKNTIIFAIGLVVTLTLIIVATVYRKNHSLLQDDTLKVKHLDNI